MTSVTKKQVRFKIYQRDGWQCRYCGLQLMVTLKNDTSANHLRASLDHIIPRSRGGSNQQSNLVTACKRCNELKADKTPSEAGLQLRPPPLGAYRFVT